MRYLKVTIASLLAEKAAAATGAVWTYENDGGNWGIQSHTNNLGAKTLDYPNCRWEVNFQSPINLIRSGSEGFDDYKIVDSKDDETKKGYTN